MNQTEMTSRFNRSTRKLENFIASGGISPIVTICTGTSGPKKIISDLRQHEQINFADLDIPKPGAKGHAGVLHSGYLGEIPVFVLEGRLHYFEGHPMFEVAFAARLLCLNGFDKHFIFTNAAGALNKTYNVGDIVLINDHVNNMGDSPLRGFPGELFLMGKEPRTMERFLDMHNAYDMEWREKCQQRFAINQLKSGIYTAVHGPEFETPAEIERKYAPHADMIGMSTIPEVIAVRHFGAKVLGLSLITNLTGSQTASVTHHGNLSVVETEDKQFSEIIQGCVEMLTPVLAR